MEKKNFQEHFKSISLLTLIFGKIYLHTAQKIYALKNSYLRYNLLYLICTLNNYFRSQMLDSYEATEIPIQFPKKTSYFFGTSIRKMQATQYATCAAFCRLKTNFTPWDTPNGRKVGVPPSHPFSCCCMGLLHILTGQAPIYPAPSYVKLGQDQG